LNNTLHFQSEADLQKQEAEQASAQVQTSLAPMLLTHIQKRWTEAQEAKKVITQRLTDCQKRRASEYSDTKIAAIRKTGGSESYPAITSSKCRGASAWIRDILLPANDKSWGIAATPQASVKDGAKENAKLIVMQQAQSAMMQGEQITPQDVEDAVGRAEESFVKEAQDKADKAMLGMENVISDQLEEGGWHKAMEEVIDDFVTYPTCFMRKGLVRNREQIKWQQTETGWIPAIESESIEEWERVSPFDIYPAAYAKDLNSAPLIQKHRFSLTQLSQMVGAKGYDSFAIRRIMDRYENGLDDESADEAARRVAEKHATSSINSSTIDALELWDDVTGKMLIDWDKGRGIIGFEVDPYKTYHVTIISIADEIISADLNPDLLGKKPYGYASFELVSGSVWGTALPEIISDPQDLCCSAARALENNLAMASAPMVAQDINALPAGAGLTTISPWKNFQYDGSKTNGRVPITFFQPNSNANELIGIFNKFSDLAEEYSGVPKYAYGNSDVGGAGRTASGLSILMSNASKGIKAAIAHIDLGIIRYLITMQYQDNMLNHPDESIKGDAQVSARGSTALLLKEVQQMRRNELLQTTANQIDMQIIGVDGRAKLLRETFKANDIDDVVPSEEDLMRMQNEASQQANTASLEQPTGQP